MSGIDEKIQAIEEEIQKTPYNKATQHHIGKLKAKLAQLKEDRLKKSKGKKGKGFVIPRGGDARVALIGFPSVGKSTLLNQLTDAKSKIAEYEFTTLEVIPGIMEYKGAKIQILDIPGVISGASRGKGHGKEVLSVVRTSDLVLILLEVSKLSQLQNVEEELYEAGIRVNQEPPRIKMKKTPRGGIQVNSSKKLKNISKETIREILNTKGIHSAVITLNEDPTPERFIDFMMANRAYIPSIIAVNKIEMAKKKELEGMKSRFKDAIFISAREGINLNSLKGEIFQKLHLMRIFMEPQGKEADYKKPLIMKESCTVAQVCDKLHREFRKKFRYAIVTGNSAKFPEQRIGLEHVLQDEDVLTLILER